MTPDESGTGEVITSSDPNAMEWAAYIDLPAAISGQIGLTIASEADPSVSGMTTFTLSRLYDPNDPNAGMEELTSSQVYGTGGTSLQIDDGLNEGDVVRLDIHFQADAPPPPPPGGGEVRKLYIPEIVHSVIVKAAQTYIALSCDTDGAWRENYRFGFNGQQKDNEVAGVGNSLDFKFRVYDSRLGRFRSVDPLAGKYPWNSTYAFAENDVIRAKDLEGAEKLIIIGGADLQSAGVSKTTIQTAEDMKAFSDMAHLGYDVKVYNTGPTNASFVDAANYISDNYKEGEPIILYGYSMGGVGVNQLAKILKGKGIGVNLMVTVDAAFGPFSKALEVPDNVKASVNMYQTDRSNAPVLSRGYPAEPQEGNDKTTIVNSNWDSKKSVQGSDAHGKMDEDTQHTAESYMKLEMMDKLDETLKDAGVKK